MMIQSFAYQEKTINKLVNAIKEFLDEKEGKNIVFQAPTGSGKTIMMAKTLETISRDSETEEIAYIRISVNELHEQARISLERYFGNPGIINCREVEDITSFDNELHADTMLFINRQKINRKGNTFMIEGEQGRDFNTVITNTKDMGRKIILIIDESHSHAGSERSQEIIQLIGPHITIEVSATPKNIISDRRVVIEPEEVIASGMIKKQILINPDIHGITSNSDLIDKALTKRKYLKSQFIKLGKDINPLMLIQIPDNRTGAINFEQEMTNLIESKGITRAKGTLAIKVADKEATTNREDIEQINSPVEVLIFKQAVALGRDCPRAHILVLQRERKETNYSFNTQTLGRIMRMPEQQHYDNRDLNAGYVYTASDNFSVIQDVAEDYAATNIMLRDNTQDKANMTLYCQHIQRVRQQHELVYRDFKEKFIEIIDGFDPKSININIVTLTRGIGGDGVLETIDKIQDANFASLELIQQDEVQTQIEYEKFLSQFIGSFGKKVSIGTLKDLLIRFIRNYYRETIDYRFPDYDVQRIVLNPANRKRFASKIEETIAEYEKYIVTLKKDTLIEKQREIPNQLSYDKNAKIYPESQKSIMQPFYAKVDDNGNWHKISGPEKDFILVLEEPENYIKRWFKNGDRDTNFFCIPFQPDSTKEEYQGFYPDFLILTNQGYNIIIETKSDKDYKNYDNYLKMLAGKQYIANYLTENDYFFMLSPLDYKSFLEYHKSGKLSEYRPRLERLLSLKHEYQNEYIKIRSLEFSSEYKKVFGSLRDLLEPNTKIYLLTAEKNYHQHKEDADEYNFGDDIIKGLELELRMKLFEEIRNDDIGYEILAKLEKAKNPNKETIGYFNLSSDKLTLGAMLILLQQNDSVRLYIENNLAGLYKNLSLLITKIEYLKDTYRNKSAHGDLIVNKEQFEEIQNILFFEEKIFMMIVM